MQKYSESGYQTYELETKNRSRVYFKIAGIVLLGLFVFLWWWFQPLISSYFSGPEEEQENVDIYGNQIQDVDGLTSYLNDGLLSGVEKDSDSDGIPDVLDTDDDNDGIPDGVDTDDNNDGIADHNDSHTQALGFLSALSQNFNKLPTPYDVIIWNEIDRSPKASAYVSGDIKAKADGTLRIRRDAVTSREIVRHGIEASDIGTNSVTSRTIRNGTITGDDISSNANLTINSLTVGGSSGAGSITTDSIVADSITTDTLTTDTLTAETISVTSLTASEAVTAQYFTATDATETSTFGQVVTTFIPTLPHLFGTWAIDAPDANSLSASLVVNPVSSVADGNLISASVAGNVKFLVDAEGDVFVNSLTSAGSVTVGATNVATLTVEGQSNLGDSPTDLTLVSGSLGIRDTTPLYAFTVGNGDLFGVNDAGAIVAATGITSSGTITFSGLSDGVVTSSSGVLSGGTIGASYITADSLDFSEFQDQLDLDASTDILMDGTEVFSITNTGTGNSFQVNDVASDTTPFIIDASGNVGIGTATPTGLLHIYSTGGTQQYITSGTASNAVLYFGDIAQTDRAGFIYRNATDDLGIKVNGSEYVTIGNTGNVGIGTTNPNAKLEVSADGTLSGSSSGQIRISGTTNTNKRLLLGFDTTSDYGWIQAVEAGVANRNLILNSAGGNVGIGITTPNQKLYVADTVAGVSYGLKLDNYAGSGATAYQTGILFSVGGDGIGGISNQRGKGGFIYASDNSLGWNRGDFMFLQNSAASVATASVSDAVVTIKNNGNVGIGTTAPGYRLSVNGAIYASSNAGIAYWLDNSKAIRSTVGAGAVTYLDLGTVNVRDGNGASANANLNVYGSGYYSGNVGVGTTGPDRKLDILDASNPQLRLTYTDGSVYTDLQTTSSGYLYLNPTGGRVGIGINTPGEALHVNGNIQITGGATNNYIGYNSLNGYNPYDNGARGGITAGNSFYINIDSNNDQTDRVFVVGKDSQNLSSATELFRIQEDGNVGIGTTTPSAKLQVVTASGVVADFRRDVANFFTVNGTTGFFETQSNNSSLPVFTVKGTGTADTFVVYDSTTPVFNIRDGGNVGIGTTTPDSKLSISDLSGTSDSTVIGTASLFVDRNSGYVFGSRNSSNNQFGIYTDSSTAYLIQRGVSGNMAFYTNGTEKMRILANGNVGIGTTTPQGLLDVEGSVGGVYIPSTGNKLIFTRDSGPSYIDALGTSGALIAEATNYISANVGGSERMRILSNGNVGIGTTTPATALDVNGSIRNSSGANYLQLQSGSAISANNYLTVTAGASYLRLESPTNYTYYRSLAHIFSNGDGSTEWARIMNGNLGIGDTTPDGLLDVEPTGAVTAASYGINLSNLTTNATTDGINKYGAYVTSTGAWTGSVGTATNNYGLYVDTVSGADNNYGAYIAGSVGIGTTSPLDKLQIQGNMRVQSSGSAIYSTIATTDANNVYLRFTTANSSRFVVGVDAADSNKLKIGGGNDFAATRFTIDSSGNVGIGDTTPASLFTVGNGDLFQVNSSGAIAAATGIISSGTITFSGLSAGGVVQAASGTGTLSVGTLGSSSITNDSLDFAQFIDAMTVDATTTFDLDTNNADLNFDGNTLFVDSSANSVGIGTVTPLGSFHSYLASTNNSVYVERGDGSQFRLASQDAQTRIGTTDATNLIFQTGGTAAGNDRMTILSTGNVGIGVTNPGFALDVSAGASGNVNTIRVTSGAGNGNSQFTANRAATSNAATLAFTTNSTTDWLIGQPYTSIGGSGSDFFLYESGVGSRLMVQKSTGNVGIGTTSPSNLLTLSGTGGSTKGITLDFTTTSSYAPIYLTEAGTTKGTIQYIGSTFATTARQNMLELVSATGGISLYAGGGQRMIVASSGNVGIGTTSPSSPLHVYSNTAEGVLVERSSINNSVIQTKNTAGSVYFGTSGTTGDFAIDDDNNFVADTWLSIQRTTGNVGIGGDATPDSLFSVGSTSQFQVNSSGAIVAATGIISSGTITLSGLSAGGVVQAASGTGTLSVGTLGASSITADSLDFAQFVDAMTVDATTTFDLDTNNADLNFDSNTLFVDSSANSVGIGTSSPSSPLTVKSSDTTNPLISLLDGSDNQIAYFGSATNSTTGRGYLVLQNPGADSNGSGITFRSNANAYTGLFSLDGSGNAVFRTYANTTTSGMYFDNLGTNTGNKIYFRTGGTNTRMTIDSVGNVGIGISIPTSRLHVQGSGTTSATSGLNVTNSSGASILFVRDDGGVGIGMTSGFNGTLNVAGPGVFQSGSVNGALIIGADVTATTRTINVRKLGVIAAPDYANTRSIELLSSDSDTALTNRVNIGGRNGASSYSATEINFVTNPDPTTTGGTIRLKITDTGNVGVGDTSPAALFTVGNGDLFQVNSSGAIAAATGITSSGNLTLSGSSANIVLGSNWLSGDGADEGVFVDNSGNVGIGVTSISAKLQVLGPIRSDGAESDTPNTNSSSFNSFQGYSNYWALRSATNHSLNFDVYNGGSSIAAMTVLQSGNIGIGDISPSALLTVGNGDLFRVNSSGAIAAATGITSSGTITFSGLSTAGIVTNTSGGVLGTTIGSEGECLTVTGGVIAWGACGGGGGAIGDAVSGGTAGSVLFIDASGDLAEDNGNFYWDTVNNRLGIGTATPDAQLSIFGTSNELRLSYDGSNYSSLSTSSSGVLNLNSSNNTESQFIIGDNTAADSSVVFDELTNDYYVGNDTATGNFMIGTGTTVGSSALMTLDSSGNLSMNTTATGVGASNLCWDGSGSSQWGACTSLKRYKDNVTNLSLGLNTLMALRPVEFDWNQNISATGHDLGFIAEEVAAVSPLLAEYGGTNGALSGVKYNLLTSLIVKSVQEQQVQIKANKNEITSLSAESQEYFNNFLNLQSSVATQNQASTQSLGSLEASVADIETNQNIVASELITLGSQIQTIHENLDALNDFYTTFSLDRYVQADEQGNIDLPEGSLRIKTLETGAVAVEVIDENAATIGESIIPSGQTTVTIETTAVSSESRIFVTPKVGEALEFSAYGIKDVTPGASFSVVIPQALTEDFQFSWWIVEEK